MTRHSEIVKVGERTIDTYVDGAGPTVVILPSYGRDSGHDYDPFTPRSIPPQCVPAISRCPTRTGWYPDTLNMQVASIDGVDINSFWAAGEAPIFEIIAALDPFHQEGQWGDLRDQLGSRVTSAIIDDASHALFPEQPASVADAAIAYLRTSCMKGYQVSSAGSRSAGH